MKTKISDKCDCTQVREPYIVTVAKLIDSILIARAEME